MDCGIRLNRSFNCGPESAVIDPHRVSDFASLHKIDHVSRWVIDRIPENLLADGDRSGELAPVVSRWGLPGNWRSFKKVPCDSPLGIRAADSDTQIKALFMQIQHLTSQ